MTTQSYVAKLSPEGRVVIPAEVRAFLEVHGGDRVQFIVDPPQVRIVSTQSLLEAVWANNLGSRAGDSVADIRELRTADISASDAKWARVLVEVADLEGSEDEIEARLLKQLDLA